MTATWHASGLCTSQGFRQPWETIVHHCAVLFVALRPECVQKHVFWIWKTEKTMAERPASDMVILSPLCTMMSGNDQDGHPNDNTSTWATNNQEDLGCGQAHQTAQDCIFWALLSKSSSSYSRCMGCLPTGDSTSLEGSKTLHWHSIVYHQGDLWMCWCFLSSTWVSKRPLHLAKSILTSVWPSPHQIAVG